MKAIHVQNDEQNTLVWQETLTPEPGPDDVLLKIHATAVNRADLLQRAGRYPVPPGQSEILGLEAAGEIAAVGSNVRDWKVGDRACCLLTGGGYAEMVVTPASLLLPIPDSMTMNQAAAIPEVFYTAFLNIFMEANQKPGDHVMIHAAASGVGTAAIQLCNAFQSPVIATASTTKIAYLQSLGVEAIDRNTEDFPSRVAELTNNRGVDIILDPVGADYLEKNILSLAPGGRLVLIGLLSGAQAELPLGPLLMKRLRIIGSVLRSRTLQEKEAITAEFRRRVWPLFETGQLKPIIHQVFPIQDANQAHSLLRSNTTIGKLVLNIIPESK